MLTIKTIEERLDKVIGSEMDLAEPTESDPIGGEDLKLYKITKKFIRQEVTELLEGLRLSEEDICPCCEDTYGLAVTQLNDKIDKIINK